MRRITACMFLFSSVVMATAPVLHFHADSLQGTLGDVFSLQWEIEHERDQQIAVPQLPTPAGDFEVLAQHLESGRNSSLLTLELSHYDSAGLYTFPAFHLYYADETGIWDSLRVDGPRIEIVSVLTAADSSFRDIKGLHRIRRPIDWMLVLIITGALVLVAAVIFLITRIKPRERSQGLETVRIPPEEAHVLALKELERLRTAGLVEQGAFKQYFSILSHILRLYYENRFLFNALEMTSSEIAEHWRESGDLPDDDRERSRNILEQADLVKFARFQPEVNAAHAALSMCVDLVEHTRIVDIEPEQNMEVTQ